MQVKIYIYIYIFFYTCYLDTSVTDLDEVEFAHNVSARSSVTCTQIDEYWPSISVYVYNIITLW